MAKPTLTIINGGKGGGDEKVAYIGNLSSTRFQTALYFVAAAIENTKPASDLTNKDYAHDLLAALPVFKSITQDACALIDNQDDRRDIQRNILGIIARSEELIATRERLVEAKKTGSPLFTLRRSALRDAVVTFAHSILCDGLEQSPDPRKTLIKNRAEQIRGALAPIQI